MTRDGGSGWAGAVPEGRYVGSLCVDVDQLFSENLNAILIYVRINFFMLDYFTQKISCRFRFEINLGKK